LCFRRADEYAESIYATMILSGRFQGTFADFLQAVRPIFHFRQQLDAFRSAFDDVRVTAFDALAENLIPAFGHWTGIPILPDVQPHKKITPDKRLIDWAARTIAADPENEVVRRLRAEFVRSDAARRLFDDEPKATFWTNFRERDEFASRSAAGLPDQFFSAPSRQKYVDARLDSSEIVRVSQAFEAWRAASRTAAPRAWGRSILSVLRRN
jgi:hypothetical protein